MNCAGSGRPCGSSGLLRQRLARFAYIDQVMGDWRPVLAPNRQAPLLKQLELDSRQAIGGRDGREVVAPLCPDGMSLARLLGIDARGSKTRMLVVKGL
jgi:hypothetical protein